MTTGAGGGAVDAGGTHAGTNGGGGAMPAGFGGATAQGGQANAGGDAAGGTFGPPGGAASAGGSDGNVGGALAGGGAGHSGGGNSSGLGGSGGGGDPPQAYCGDIDCNGTEDCETCPGDCGQCAPTCGDGPCNNGETCQTCPADCDPCAPTCGDVACDDATEDCLSCPEDCGACAPVCGDSKCNGAETCATCPADCSCPPTCGTLAERLHVTSIAISPAAKANAADLLGPFYNWGAVPALLTAAEPSGRARIGWVDNSGSVHVTPLGDDDARRASDIVLAGQRLRGLVAHDDGAALLVVADATCTALRLVGRQDNGSERFPERELTDSNSCADTWHQGRLAFADNKYAAYFAIHATAGWAAGHEGDMYKISNASGNAASGGWDWGCSHSMDTRIEPKPGGGFTAVCVSDCYPGKGIYANNSALMAASTGNCAGTTSARLGGVAYVGSRLYASYVSNDGRSSFDVGLTWLNASNLSGAGQVWITENSKAEANPKLARFGPDHMLLSWTDASTQVFQVLDASGNLVGGQVTLAASVEPISDFVTMPNGDVVWAYQDSDLQQLRFARLTFCE